LTRTADDCFVWFFYEAKSGYFDYCDKISPSEAVGWFKNLAYLLKDYSVAHQELFSLFHDNQEETPYDIVRNFPVGCIVNPDKYLEYSNFRRESTIADFSLDHLRDDFLLPSLVNSLFQVSLYVSQRLERQGLSEKYLAEVLEEGFLGYSKIITGKYLSQLDRVDYPYYSKQIIEGIRNKHNGSNLGNFNSKLSIHSLVDLVDFVALNIFIEISKSRNTSSPFSYSNKIIEPVSYSGVYVRDVEKEADFTCALGKKDASSSVEGISQKEINYRENISVRVTDTRYAQRLFGKVKQGIDDRLIGGGMSVYIADKNKGSYGFLPTINMD